MLKSLVTDNLRSPLFSELFQILAHKKGFKTYNSIGYSWLLSLPDATVL